MTIISQLIIKTWFKFQLSSLIILTLIASSADIINGLSRGWTIQYALLRYSLMLPTLLTFIVPVTCLIASLFSINQLKNNNELTAILSIGYKPSSFYFVFFMASFTIFSFNLLLSTYAVPLANKKTNSIITVVDIKKTAVLINSNVLDGGSIWYKTGNYFARYKAFDPNNKSIHDFHLYFFDKHTSQGTKIVSSDKAQYADNKWTLTKGKQVGGLNERTYPTEKNFKKAVYKLKIQPDDFKELEEDLTTLTFPKLFRFIKNLQSSGISINFYLILLYEQISRPLSCIIFALFPIGQIHSPNRRSSSLGKNIAIIFLFSIVYSFIVNILRTLGSSGTIPPIVACFGPIFLFGFLMSWYLYKKKKV